MARKRATLTDLLNELTFEKLFQKYKLLSINMFEWEGLPDGIEGRYIENYLFDDGKAIFFRDPQMSYMCLKTSEGFGFNVYNEPLNWNAHGHNYNRSYSADDCVIINNNSLRLATDKFIMFYVNKLAEAERTMDVNVKAVKTPYIIACDDKDVLTFKRIFQMVDGNTPAIYADKGLNLDALQVLKTGAEFLCNDIQDYKKSVENELLTFLGINNLAVDKKERINVDEANSNNEITKSFGDLQLEAREKACEEINQKFKLNISVRRKECVENVENYVERDDEADA